MPNFNERIIEIPDYANRVSKSTGIQYTAGTNGYLWLFYSASSDTTVKIDGIEFKNAGNTTTNTVLYPIKKGSTYSFAGAGSYGFSCYFIPAIETDYSKSQSLIKY